MQFGFHADGGRSGGCLSRSPKHEITLELGVPGHPAVRGRLGRFERRVRHLRELGGRLRGMLHRALVGWYDGVMDRVSGWYKRRTTAWIWGLAFVITLCMNADTIRITRILWSNQAVRSAVVDAAKARAQAAPPEPMPLVEYSDPQNPEESKPVGLPADTLTSQERALLGQLMLGWKEDLAELDQIKQAELNKKSQGQEGALWWASLREWWAPHFLGWLFTMVALSLGAPFWFDTLNKFMNIRNGGKAPAATQQPPATASAQAVAKGAGA